MPDIKISQLTEKTTILGTDLVQVVDSSNKKATVTNLLASTSYNNIQASGSGGVTLKTSGGTTVAQWGGGGSTTFAVSNDLSVSGGIIQSNNLPAIYQRDANAAADTKNWIQWLQAGNWTLSTATDAAPTTNVVSAVAIQRTGTSVTEIELNATTFDFNGSMELSGSAKFQGITTTASAANAFLDSGDNNNLLRSTSSLRYKKDIEDLDDEHSKSIYEMRPVWYRSKAEKDNPDWSWFGLIAEEMAEIEPRLVHYTYSEDSYDIEVDEQGNETKTLKDNAVRDVPDGIQYDRLTVLLLKEIQQLRAELDELKK